MIEIKLEMALLHFAIVLTFKSFGDFVKHDWTQEYLIFVLILIY